jgi:DNA-binding NarL/FixJ family response regulator
MPNEPPIRVLIVDDHRLMREGLARIAEHEPDIDIVGSVSTGEEAVAAARRDPPHLILMDLRMPGMDGVQAIRAIRRTGSDIRIIVLTMYDGDEDIHRALEAGADTYLLKDCPADDLLRVIRDVHAGHPQLPADIEARLSQRIARPALTRREVAILEYVFEGLRNKEIGHRLSICETTVQVHLRRIFSKLDVHDRTAAVNVALRRGILHLK